MSFCRKILFAVFFCFLTYGLIMLSYYPTSESVWIIIFVSALAIILTVFWRMYVKMIKRYSIAKIITLFMALCAAFFVFVEVLIISYEKESYGGKADVVLVLGAGIRGDVPTGSLKYRLDTALKYLATQDEDTLVVVSGGAASSGAVSEASVMRDYLLGAGVDEKSIVLEEKSANTYENFTFSKDILDDIYDGEYTLAFVTSAFHIYRSGEIAKNLSLNAHGIAAPSTWYMLPVHHVREFLSVVNMWFDIF